MNANFGIIFTKADRETLLSPVVETRTWGDEKVETGVVKYKFDGLEDISFELYPLTEFVLNNLPEKIRHETLEYAWMNGLALDNYEEWLRGDFTNDQSGFEQGIKSLLKSLSFCAVMFAAEGERLQQFVHVNENEFISILRKNVLDVIGSNGFLAVLN